MAEVQKSGQFVWIRQDGTGDRRSRASSIGNAKRQYEKANGVRLVLDHKSYDEKHGFLSRSEFRYRIEGEPGA